MYRGDSPEPAAFRMARPTRDEATANSKGGQNLWCAGVAKRRVSACADFTPCAGGNDTFPQTDRCVSARADYSIRARRGPHSFPVQGPPHRASHKDRTGWHRGRHTDWRKAMHRGPRRPAGWAAVPWQHQRQHSHPAAAPSKENRAVRAKNFFMDRISLESTRSLRPLDGQPENSTPRLLMCKRNACIFPNPPRSVFATYSQFISYTWVFRNGREIEIDRKG